MAHLYKNYWRGQTRRSAPTGLMLTDLQPVDIVIFSNGPGEIVTWVRPVVRELRKQLGRDRALVRISIILSPCAHRTGQEAKIARSYSEVDRVHEPQYFISLMLLGKTAENWDWRKRGVILFLGGDQLYPNILGKRLGYATVIYVEWKARWYRWVHQFAVTKPEIVASLPRKYRHKCTVVGDLIADVALENKSFPSHSNSELIGLLPGSKVAKLSQGVPLALAIAQSLHSLRPTTRFILPVAPSLDLSTLARFANPQFNPLIAKLGGVSAKLHDVQNRPYFITSEGVKIELYTAFPAYSILSQCHLCLTTVGANTAELAALTVPMIVLLPTYQLDAMRAWGGIAGILANLPGMGKMFAKGINWLFLKQGQSLALPNIWAKEEIVPELVGQLQPEEIAQQVLYFLDHPETLQIMRDRLRQIRGQLGASEKLVKIVVQELDKTKL